MKWLVGYVLVSMGAAFIVIRVLEYVVGGVAGAVAAAAKPTLFVGVGTSVMAALGNRGFTKWVKSLRQKSKGS